ncbi:MAG: ABC transporter permease [Candidatus Kariarchaeaceae archaeon]|jgi:ABC-type polysaccharide/polyol phosphate export permease
MQNLQQKPQQQLNTQENFNIYGANYQAIFAIVRKRWQILVRYPLNLTFWLFAPILWLLPTLIFGTILIGSRYSDRLGEMAGTTDVWVFTGVGLAYLNFLFMTMWTTAYAIRDEEFQGTLESMYVTPPSKAVVVLSNGVYAVTYGGFTLLAQMIVLMALHGGVDTLQMMYATGFAIVSLMLIQGISVCLSALVLTFKQGWRIVFTFQVLLGIITPSTFPIDILPEPLYTMSKYSPFTIGVNGFREVLLFNPNNGHLLGMLKMILWALILFLCSVKFYSFQEKNLMRKGSLGKY